MIEQPRESATFWHEPALSNLELLRATYITHAFAPHFHEGFAIGVIEVGAETFTYRRNTHIAAAGNIVVMNPAEIHTGQALTPNGWSYRMVYPAVSLLQRAASEVVGRQCDVPFFAQPVLDDPATARLLRRLHLALEAPTTSLLERESRLVWTFAHLVARHADSPVTVGAVKPEPDYVDKVRQYLHAHYADHFSLEDLARIVHVSPFHLLRVFRNAVGMPPHLYLTHVRVQRAKALLAAAMPIAEVALQTGFVDQSHLSRHFKRIVGIAPGHYRRIQL